MNSQRELTPELIRAELALRYLYKFNPTNLSDCQKVIEEFSQGDTELIILPTTEDESFDLAKSGSCTLSILRRGANTDVEITRDSIVRSAHRIIRECTVDGEVAGVNYIPTECGSVGVVAVGKRISPTYNPGDWGESTQIQVGIYKLTRNVLDGDLGVGLFDEELTYILDSMMMNFWENAEEATVKQKSRTWMKKDETHVHEVEITYQAQGKIYDIDLDYLTLLRIFREAFANPEMRIPKSVDVVVKKHGEKVGVFSIDAGESSDKSDAVLIQEKTRQIAQEQSPPILQISDGPTCIWNHWPEILKLENE